jgi:hypothetical protein
MRLTLICVAALLAACPAAAQPDAQPGAQPNKFRTRYFEAQGRVEISTEPLRLGSARERIIDVAVFASYPTTWLAGPPDAVVIRLYAYGDALVYEPSERRRLTVTVDGETWPPLPTHGYTRYTQRLKRERAKNTDPPPRPQDFTLVESMDARVTFEQLSAIASGRDVRLQLGDAAAEVAPDTAARLRAFVKFAAGGPEASKVELVRRTPRLHELPSEFARATREEALKFLREGLARTAHTPYERLEDGSFEGCRIKYRIVRTRPLLNTAPPFPRGGDRPPTLEAPDVHPPVEFHINLADLDHTSVQVMTDGSMILFDTTRKEKKIKFFTKDERGGRVEEARSTASFLLRPNGEARRIGQALIRAIEACQEARF